MDIFMGDMTHQNDGFSAHEKHPPDHQIFPHFPPFRPYIWGRVWARGVPRAMVAIQEPRLIPRIQAQLRTAAQTSDADAGNLWRFK